MDKEFIKYNKQMKYLRDNKKISCNGTDDKIILCRNGYFNLVNGYKKPFITGVDSNGKHTYIKDTSIKHLDAVKKFDDELRYLLLRYITTAEEEIRSFFAYKFDEINKNGQIKWYQVDSFKSNKDIKKVVGVISKSYSEISKSTSEYVEFYMENHKVIPTWILVKVVNFSTFIDIIDLSKDSVKNAICDLYDIKDSRGYNDYKLLIGSLHWLRKIRNACAHNERIYTIQRTDKRIIDKYILMLPKSYKHDKSQKIIDLLIYLKYYINPSDYKRLINDIKKMLTKLSSFLPNSAYQNVRASMGIKNISHLDTLLSIDKTIKYNKF